jgi:hypothetical protein
MANSDRVFLISFRLRGKEYRMITTAPDGTQAIEDLRHLSPEVELIQIAEFGLFSEMNRAEFERLGREAVESTA